MELYNLFYKWVPVWIKLLVAFLILFTVFIGNGIFLGNITEMYNDLGEYVEPFTQASNALYIGMGLGLMFVFRLKQRFSSKTLLIYGLLMMVIMHLICATTKNTSLMVAACFVLGFTKIAALIEVYFVWIFIWSKEGERSRFYPFIYGTALIGVFFITWLTTNSAYTSNWRYAYLSVIIMLLFCILLTLIFVENHPLKKRIPLYQIDWIGLILLASLMLIFDYVVVYAKVENWLESSKIIGALFCSVIIVLLFVRREIRIKRPLFDVSIFRIPNFRLGLLYFILLGIFVPSTFQSSFTSGVLHYEQLRNSELNLYIIPGVIVGAVVCFFWYLKKIDEQLLICIGFFGFVCYHLILYNSFANDFNFYDFILPSLIKGFSMTTLYIAIGLYTTNELPMHLTLNAGGMMILIRSFVGSATFSGLYNYIFYKQKIQHSIYLSGILDANDSLINQQSSATSLYKSIQIQATLSASKEISGYIIAIGIVIVVFILFNYCFKKINHKKEIIIIDQ
jgi:MFS transporter, DHA2 family, multidrug resistance protein